MKRCSIAMLIGISLILSGCSSQRETMSLLDENIERIEISKSNGVGSVNEEVLVFLDDSNTIKVFEKVIKNAVLTKKDKGNEIPDFDIVVSYGDKFPKHAIHIWLGEEEEKSTLSYLVEGDGTYTISSKDTKRLRDLIFVD